MSSIWSGAGVSPRNLIRHGHRTFVLGLVYAGLLSGCINLLQLTVPLFMLQVHDRVINSQSIDTLTMLCIIAFGALALYGVLEFIRALTFQVMGSAFIRRMNLPTLEAAVADSLQQGSPRATQALRDLNDVRSFITGNAIGAPMEALWCPIFLGVLLLLHPVYGLVAFASAVLLIGISLLADLMTRRLMREASESNVENVSRIGANLRHAEAIEAMGMLPALARRWRDAQIHTVELMDSGNRRSRAFSSFTRSCRYAMQIAVLTTGAVLVIRQEVTPGSMIAASIIMGRLLLPFDTMVDNWRQWVNAMSAWKRVRELVESARASRQTSPTPWTQGPLTVDRLIYAVPGAEVPVLRGISFALEPGDVLGVVGPSAAGKSTLSRLLVGVLRPTAGGVFLDGNNTFLWERGSFGDMVGYLPQSVSLLDGTIRDNIARMRDEDPRLVIEAARAAGVHEMIGRLPLGYDTPVGDGRYTLSGGQKQRIALARALYGRPRLIVLDEPNANLDHDGEQALLRAIAQASLTGAIVILVAHRQSLMQAANKLLVLQEGRVAQFGPRTAVVDAMGEKAVATPQRARLAAVKTVGEPA